MNLVTAGRADLGPGCTGIGGPINALQGSHDENAGIGWCLSQSVDRLAFEERGFMPGAAGIMADPQAAVVGVLPGTHVERGGMRGIDHNAIEDESVAAVELGQTMPGCASIQ